MTDVLSWSIDLGRWFGVKVRVHYFLLAFALGWLLTAAVGNLQAIVPTACWLLLLVLVLALHELGHALMARFHDVEADEVRLWPLGNLVVPGPGRGSDSLAVAAAGLLTSLSLAIGTAVLLAINGTWMVFNPFGVHDKAAVLYSSGAPVVMLTDRQVPSLQPLWWLGWFGYLNWVVFLANLIPALPFDGGRILRGILARSSIGLTRENPYAQWTARGVAGILTLVGLVKIITDPYPNGMVLVIIAILIELVVRTESRMIEDGGFFEDGVFGYDFSEGYTSLEGSTAQVRPVRESAIKRWRRRRSDLRRQRRAEREAAEELRLDEILDKVYRNGKASLTDDEQRFLFQVSSKLRNRPKVRE